MCQYRTRWNKENPATKAGLQICLLIGGLGYYRGWFGLSSTEQEGATNIELKIDKQKIKEDADSIKDKAREITSSIEEDASGTESGPTLEL